MKYGFTDECQAFTQLASGTHNAKVPHDDRCRDRIGELMAEDDDQRHVERVSSRTVSEIDIRVWKPEKRWTLVNHRSSHNQFARKTSHNQFHSQLHSQFPKFELVDHRAQLDQVQEQVKRAQMTIVKRNVSDSQRAEARRGKARM